MRRHGHRLTVLNDNMGVVLAVQKGRCHNYQLLRVIRRIAAYCLAAGIRCSLRWVPSERNVADKASRVWEETRGDTTANRKQGIQEEESRSVQSERGEKGQRQIDQPCSEERSWREKSRSRSKLKKTEGKRPLERGLRLMVQSSKARMERARARQRKYGKQLRVFRGEMSLLEMNSIKEPARKDYSRRLDEFYDFIARTRLPVDTEENLDIALCEFGDHMYLNGESNSAGHKLNAALEFFRPEAARAGELKLPRFKRSLKGWRRLAPTQTRLPMVEFLKSCISGLMMHQGWHEMALFNEVTFSTYARPGEMMRVMAVDVVQKNDQYHHHVIVLSPFERGISSKTSIFDEVLVLDDTRMPELGDLVVDWAKERIQQEGEEASLWSFRAEQLLKVWRDVYKCWK